MRGEAAGPRLRYLLYCVRSTRDRTHTTPYYLCPGLMWYALIQLGSQLGFYKLHTVRCYIMVEGILQKSRQKKECMQITQLREKTSIEQFWDIQTELVKRSKSSNPEVQVSIILWPEITMGVKAAYHDENRSQSRRISLSVSHTAIVHPWKCMQSPWQRDNAGQQQGSLRERYPVPS